MLGVMEYFSPTHAGMKAFIMTKVGDVMMLSGMLLLFMFAGTFGFRELVGDTAWAVEMSAQGLLVPAFVLTIWWCNGKICTIPT